MPKSILSRDVSALTDDLVNMRSDVERMRDLFLGLALLFAAVGALVLGAGLWLQAPVFAFSAAFAVTAALAFAISAGTLGRRRASAQFSMIGAPPARWAAQA